MLNVCWFLDFSHPNPSSVTFDLSQADMCMPRLNEGDQVVLINGRDISEHTHDDVVMLIKASCEDQSGELILLVRPNGTIRLDGAPKFEF